MSSSTRDRHFPCTSCGRPTLAFRDMEPIRFTDQRGVVAWGGLCLDCGGDPDWQRRTPRPTFPVRPEVRL